MTEAEWLTGTDPGQMLDYLHGGTASRVLAWLSRLRGRDAEPDPGPPSERKLRLFACAYCRRIAELMEDERSRRAVEVTELHADGRAGDDELEAARAAALDFYEVVLSRGKASSLPAPYLPQPEPTRAWLLAARAAVEVTRSPGDAVATARQAAMAVAVELDNPAWAAEAAGDAARVALLRDIFGNPFRPARVDPSWLRWNDGTVPKIARGIWDDYRFADLPILHDALLDAGCDEEALLAHCRSPEGHVRGCWVLDLLLGKT
jgi:hypothetical protein